MKKVLNIGIAGTAFIVDEDAYELLADYLKEFRSKSDMGYQTKEVMDDIEGRISELFIESLPAGQVVNIALVQKVINLLGMPDGSTMGSNTSSNYASSEKKLFRDPDSKLIGGVCTGLGHYLSMDPVVLRILVLVVFLFSCSFSGWIYVILWIVVPLAKTPAEKCQMRGWPVTAENINRVRNR